MNQHQSSAIRSVGVVGAGTMGSAIAQHFAMKGLEVTLLDLSAQSLERGLAGIRASLDEAVQKKVLTPEARDHALARLRTASEPAGLRSADLVVEAVFEDLAVKRKLFASLESVVSNDCVLATNTSSFLVADVARGLSRPERVVGVHYFYHAAKNKLVELIAGPETDRDLVSRLHAFYSSIDKIPIIVRDAPGFAVNRFFVPWLNEATRLLEEGKGSIQRIDEIGCELFEIGMGPFALMNATGVPIAEHAASGLASKLGRFYAPSWILQKQVASRQPWNLADTTVPSSTKDDQAVRDRLIAASLGVAAQMVAEGVTDAAQADLGARVGLRWARGPLELIQKLGVPDVRRAVSACFRTWDLPTPELEPRISWVESQVEGTTGHLIFNIPDRMNPLSEATVACLETEWARLSQDPQVARIIISGRGKAFVAGADIKFFLDSIAAGNLDRIVRFTERGQRLFDEIARSPKPTTAFLNGLTLGGGLELALACQRRIATPRAVLGFPETGIGIYPGLGGTQRTARIVGRGSAKYLVATGQLLNAEAALRYGLVDSVIARTPADLRELSALASPEPTPPHRRGPTENLSAEATAFESFDGTDLSSPSLEPYAKTLKRKAPVALGLAMRLIDQGLQGTLEQGLRLELSHLREIFATEDARVGLQSVLTKSKPEFKGR